eukprot:m.16170 g.16170  ORF g.16170 m.16170 type:complete len:358 (+) comp3481_c0_seq1:95-1168(+)
MSRLVRPARVLFFGTSEFAVPILQAMTNNLHGLHAERLVDHIEVVCPRAPPARGKAAFKQHPVARLAMAHHLPLHSPPPRHRWEQWCEEVELATGLPFDFGVVASFGHLLPSCVIDMFRRGALNVHPSALPRWRGAAPIQHTLIAGDTETAVSIIELSRGRFDHGHVLARQACAVPPRATYGQLERKLADIGANLTLDVIANWEARVDEKRPQLSFAVDGQQPAPVAHKVTPATGRINWAQDTAAAVHRKFRALHGQVGITTTYHGKPLHIVELALEGAMEKLTAKGDPLPSDAQPGTLVYRKPAKALFVRAADDWVAVTRVKIPTKNSQNAAQFANHCRILKPGAYTQVGEPAIGA